MKVLYFHQHFSTPSGSTGIRSYQMARKLIAQGHSVTMVCGAYGAGQTGLEGPYHLGRREGFVDGIRVIEIALPYDNTLGFIRRAVAFFKFAFRSVWIALREPCDMVFATSTPLTVAFPGVVARWLRNKPFVFEVRDLWPELPKAMGVITNPVLLWAMGVLEWVSYRSAHRVVGLSPGIVEGIRNRGVPAERVTMIPNGCDLDIFTTSAEPWRPEGIAESDLLAIFAGTHGLANGLDAVLDAAAELKRRGRSDIKLLLIGNGKLKTELQERAVREGLDNVVFHDPVTKARLAGLLQSADIGMQVLANVPAFYYGTSPNKFFDYIAAGLPVLNNYPGWLAAMIESEQCGYAVPPADPSAFADALERAAASREELEAMGANSRALAEREFDRAKLSGQWASWIEGALRSG